MCVRLGSLHICELQCMHPYVHVWHLPASLSVLVCHLFRAHISSLAVLPPLHTLCICLTLAVSTRRQVCCAKGFDWTVCFSSAFAFSYTQNSHVVSFLFFLAHTRPHRWWDMYSSQCIHPVLQCCKWCPMSVFNHLISTIYTDGWVAHCQNMANSNLLLTTATPNVRFNFC